MTIYIKTRKGMDELLAKRNGIDARLNTALIFVDGQRSTQDLLAALKASGLPADTLEILLHGGYIAEVKPKVTALPAAVQVQKPVAEPTGNESGSGHKDASQHVAFQALYEFMVKKSKELLGLRGFTFQLRIERAQDVASLLELVNAMSEAVAKKHGLQAANVFLRDLSQLTGRAKLERHGLRLIAERRASDRPEFQTVSQFEVLAKSLRTDAKRDKVANGRHRPIFRLIEKGAQPPFCVSTMSVSFAGNSRDPFFRHPSHHRPARGVSHQILCRC